VGHGGPPGGHLSGGLLQHQASDGVDVPGLLGQRDEIVREQASEGGVLPADERLDAEHLGGLQVGYRLVVEAKLVARDGDGQVIPEG